MLIPPQGGVYIAPLAATLISLGLVDVHHRGAAGKPVLPTPPWTLRGAAAAAARSKNDRSIPRQKKSQRLAALGGGSLPIVWEVD